MNALALNVCSIDDFPRPQTNDEDKALSIPLDLHPALTELGAIDGNYVVISDVPRGVRFSAGRSNTNSTWSLLPDELTDLAVILPPGAETKFALTVSVATPDPDGYEFASTTAQFSVLVATESCSIPFNSLKRLSPRGQPDWPSQVARAFEAHQSRYKLCRDDREPGIRKETAVIDMDERARLRTEWQADEDVRMARARDRWQTEAENVWLQRAAELAECHQRELKEAEARWYVRASEQLTANDAIWSARLAANEARWRSEEWERFAAAVDHWRTKQRSERWRRAASWLIFSITLGSMMLPWQAFL